MTIGLIDGSQFWADQQSNERYLPELEARMKLQRAESHSPPLVGYSRLVQMIDELTDHVYTSRGESGNWDRIPARPKPKYLRDMLDERRVAKGRNKIDNVLDIAHGTAKGGDTGDDL